LLQPIHETQAQKSGEIQASQQGHGAATSSKIHQICCDEIQMTPSNRTGFPALTFPALKRCLKPKNSNYQISANLVFLERRMRSAAKLVERTSGHWFLG
jgi:hypothetical protein